jgi:hypothetical protein
MGKSCNRREIFRGKWKFLEVYKRGFFRGKGGFLEGR